MCNKCNNNFAWLIFSNFHCSNIFQYLLCIDRFSDHDWYCGWWWSRCSWRSYHAAAVVQRFWMDHHPHTSDSEWLCKIEHKNFVFIINSTYLRYLDNWKRYLYRRMGGIAMQYRPYEGTALSTCCHDGWHSLWWQQVRRTARPYLRPYLHAAVQYQYCTLHMFESDRKTDVWLVLVIYLVIPYNVRE